MLVKTLRKHNTEREPQCIHAGSSAVTMNHADASNRRHVRWRKGRKRELCTVS